MKKILFFLALIAPLLGSCSTEARMSRYKYVRNVRAQLFKANGNDSVPAQMGRLEYNQRTRAQIIRESQSADTIKLFPGLLINSKRGLNEKATFVIKSRFVKDVPWTFTLNPQEELEISLPAGEYTIEIRCGYYCRTHVFHVDPRRTHYINGRTVYFAAEKSLSDL